jgi:hypothetical protein
MYEIITHPDVIMEKIVIGTSCSFLFIIYQLSKGHDFSGRAQI